MPRHVKRGDTHPPITFTVSDAEGPVPLGDADEVLLIYRLEAEPTDNVVAIVADVVDPAAVRGSPNAGKGSANLDADDTDVVGDHPAEVQVTWSPGEVQTFPDRESANEHVFIDADLGPEV